MNRTLTLLKTLSDHEVEFLVVGGFAAATLGAPVITLDLDIVHFTTPDNIDRLLAALRDLEARYRYRPELHPTVSHLSTPGHQLLLTRLGPLDVLGAIGNGHAYSGLLPHTEEIEFAPGLRCRVLDLETQIAVKEEIGSEKDRAMLPLLRRVLAEKRRLQ